MAKLGNFGHVDEAVTEFYSEEGIPISATINDSLLHLDVESFGEVVEHVITQEQMTAVLGWRRGSNSGMLMFSRKVFKHYSCDKTSNQLLKQLKMSLEARLEISAVHEQITDIKAG